MAPLVWLITGTSSGFGHEIAMQALARGDTVIATSRSASKLDKLASLGAHTASIDVTADDASVIPAVQAAVRAAGGRVDVLVNNSGFIQEGANEALSQAELQASFDCNVFGAVRMLRAVLPYMRAQRSGTVVNMGSVAGWRGGAGYGLYNATKFALAGISESLKLEMLPLGVDVVCVEPGYFRTGFLNANNRIKASKGIEDYSEMERQVEEMLDKQNAGQVGDPVKGVQVIVEAATKTGRFAGVEQLPGRLGLGSDAVGVISGQLKKWTDEHEKWVSATSNTDFD